MLCRPSLAVWAVASWLALLESPTAQSTPRLDWFGVRSGDGFGDAVAVLGDVDGDFIDDFAVGAPGDDTAALNAGRVFVFSGGSGQLLYTLDGAGPIESFGWSLAGVGDVNGDGIGDLAVGAIGRDVPAPNAGAVTVHSGVDGSVLLSFTGTGPMETFGWSVAAVGDIDRDGYADIAVGAPGDDQRGAESGSVSIFSGRTGVRLRQWFGAAGEQFGRAIAGLGDIDRDAAGDLAVGIPFADDAAQDGGAVAVYSGGTGVRLYRVGGNFSQGYFGWSVAGRLGDHDGDGAAEWAAGAPFALGTLPVIGGVVTLHAAANGATLRNWSSPIAQDRLGWSVAAAGDVDADGHVDIIVGAPGHDEPARSSVGKTQIVSGADGSLLFESIGANAGDEWGRAAVGGLDLDFDGLDEVLLGSGLTDAPSRPDAGRVQSLSWSAPPGSGPHPRFRTFGVGCASSHGTLPRLTAIGRAAVGEFIEFRLASAPRLRPAVLSLDPNFGNLDLGLLGATGCILFTSSVIGTSAIVDSLGRASASTLVPSTPQVIGTQNYAQWVILDPLANGLGVITSNAGFLSIGVP